MSEREKLDMFRLSGKEEEFLAHVEKAGIKSLDARQNRRFQRLLKKQASRSCAGGVKKAAFVAHLQEKYKISEDDLRNGKVRSPYLFDVRFDIECIVFMVIVSYVLILAGFPRGNIALGSACAIVGITIFRELRMHRRLRKINKQYMSGSMDEAEVREAMMQSILAVSAEKWNH